MLAARRRRPSGRRIASAFPTSSQGGTAPMHRRLLALAAALLLLFWLTGPGDTRPAIVLMRRPEDALARPNLRAPEPRAPLPVDEESEGYGDLDVLPPATPERTRERSQERESEPDDRFDNEYAEHNSAPAPRDRSPGGHALGHGVETATREAGEPPSASHAQAGRDTDGPATANPEPRVGANGRQEGASLLTATNDLKGETHHGHSAVVSDANLRAGIGHSGSSKVKPGVQYGGAAREDQTRSGGTNAATHGERASATSSRDSPAEGFAHRPAESEYGVWVAPADAANIDHHPGPGANSGGDEVDKSDEAGDAGSPPPHLVGAKPSPIAPVPNQPTQTDSGNALGQVAHHDDDGDAQSSNGKDAARFERMEPYEAGPGRVVNADTKTQPLKERNGHGFTEGQQAAPLAHHLESEQASTNNGGSSLDEHGEGGRIRNSHSGDGQDSKAPSGQFNRGDDGWLEEDGEAGARSPAQDEYEPVDARSAPSPVHYDRHEASPPVSPVGDHDDQEDDEI